MFLRSSSLTLQGGLLLVNMDECRSDLAMVAGCVQGSIVFVGENEPWEADRASVAECFE